MQQPNRLYLNVPYAEKDAAKELGARWDAKLKKWFVPSVIEPLAFAKWFVNNPESPPAPTQQPQTTALKLTIELVPQTCWYSKVNRWSDREVDLYIERCFEIWIERSRFEWTLDISYLDRL